jgi:hypothetical protein
MATPLGAVLHLETTQRTARKGLAHASVTGRAVGNFLRHDRPAQN